MHELMPKGSVTTDNFGCNLCSANPKILQVQRQNVITVCTVHLICYNSQNNCGDYRKLLYEKKFTTQTDQNGFIPGSRLVNVSLSTVTESSN